MMRCSDSIKNKTKQNKTENGKPFLVILITTQVWTPLVYASLTARNGLPQWLNGKASLCGAGGAGSAPGSGRSPGGGHGSPLQYSCLKNSMDSGAWWAIVHGVPKELDTQHSDSTTAMIACLE